MITELDQNDNSEIKKVESFLNNCSFSDYMQSIEWNKIRNEKNKFFLYYANENGNIIWSCSFFEKEVKGEKILYAPRGPVVDYNDKQSIKVFFENIKIWLEDHNYNKIIINPIVYKNNFELFPKDYKYEITRSNDYVNLLDSCKLAVMDIIFDENILINKLPSKFRQNTRRSYRKGLTRKISNIVDFQNFYKLYLDTSKRHDFKPHTLDYFKNIVNEFKDNLIFIEVWHDDTPLAMSIDIIYKDKLIYLYGVSSSENRNLLGMYNLQWGAIEYCIKNKIAKYDFGGVFCSENETDNKDYGLYKFKKGYCYKGFIDIMPDITITFGGNND